MPVNTTAVHWVPRGLHRVTPYMLVPDAARTIDFLKRVFDAGQIEVMKQPDGRVMHAEVKIGDSVIMMGEPMGEFKAMPCSLYIYVQDTDAAYQRALAAGATSLMAPADQFYGDRNAGVKDSAGNIWWIGTHIEDVSPEEMKRRAAARFEKQPH